MIVIKDVQLETVCGVTSRLPINLNPEAAFIGRSNVGKSSLINVLINRKSFARTSSVPGKTQTVNYYNVNQKFYLVDLPGYGYAEVPEKVREQWGVMVNNYLKRSGHLKVIFLLIDIRREPSENDKNMYDLLVSKGYSPIITATKVDKIPRSMINKNISIIRKKLRLSEETVLIPFSASTKQGRAEIMEAIEEHLSI